MAKVHKAMNQVKLELAAHGGITKDRTAPDAIGGYAFRGIDDADNVLCGLTAKYGLVLYPRIVAEESVVQADNRGKLQKHVKLTMELDIVHEEDSSTHTVRSVGEGIDGGDKATGKAFSNARKIAVFGAFQIPTHGENVEQYATEVQPPAQAQQPAPQQSPPPPPANGPGPAKARERKTRPQEQPAPPPQRDGGDAPFPHGDGGHPRSNPETLLKSIGECETFPLLHAIAKDASELTDEQAKGELFHAVKARAVFLFSKAQNLAEVKEGFPLVTALGQPAEVAQAANAAYARFRTVPTVQQ